MDKIFEEMFSKQPDEIINGDYFYRVPWIELEQQKYGGWIYSESDLENYEKRSKAKFKNVWEERTFQGEFDKTNDDLWLKSIKGKNKNAKIEEIFYNIARESTPFMDIASSEGMGLASYILKLNPKTPCLVTDIGEHNIKRLRSRIGENLPEYDISLASFDNLEMPIKDASINCVTSIGAIMHSYMNRSWSKDDETDPKIETFEDFQDAKQRKSINEVYRVLKPGGLFITVEDEWDWEYDLKKIDDYFAEHEKLYGLYTHDRVRERIAEFEVQKERQALRDTTFTSEGFTVECEKRYNKKLPLNIVAQSLSFAGDPVRVKECDRTEDIINIYTQVILYILRKPK